MSSIFTLYSRYANGTSHRYETVPDEERILQPKKYFQSSDIFRDMIISLTDGLTIPFALAAGLSSLGHNYIVILGCLVELIASTISKTASGWATSKAAEYHYWAERKEEEFEVRYYLESEIQETIGKFIHDIMQPYELDSQSLAPLFEKLSNNPEKFVDFIMKFKFNLEKPDPTRSLQSALVIGTSYFVSGLIPIIPYFFIKDCVIGLYLSGGITLSCLILFGYVK
ncbi:6494_t:CDS:2, partial [Funneliformis geosporum]